MLQGPGIFKGTNKLAHGSAILWSFPSPQGFTDQSPKSREKLLPKAHCPMVVNVTAQSPCGKNGHRYIQVIYQRRNANGPKPLEKRLIIQFY